MYVQLVHKVFRAAIKTNKSAHLDEREGQMTQLNLSI